MLSSSLPCLSGDTIMCLRETRYSPSSLSPHQESWHSGCAAATLPHGTAASHHTVWPRGLQRPSTDTRSRAGEQPQSPSKRKNRQDCPAVLVTKSTPCLERLCVRCTPMQLIQALLFWFELPNLALAQDSQSTTPTGPKKGMRPRSCLSVCTLPWPPCVAPGGGTCTSSRTYA